MRKKCAQTELAAALLMAPTADRRPPTADRRPPTADRRPPTAVLQAQNLKHGIGIIFGEPTGISYKYQLNQKAAIDAAAAWSFSNKNRFHIQADYILHDYSLIQVKKGRLPFYYGVGGRVEFREEEKNHVGVRVPLGIDYYFSGVPVDVFAEIVPVVELLPDTGIDLEGAIGVRYWF